MKTIFVIRHAKSDQRFFGNDFERPLNERGNADAPVMARRLFEKKHRPAALVSSPAVRAKTTAEAFAQNLQMAVEEIIFVPALYHAPKEIFYDVVSALPDELESAAIFSHNPGITYFVNSLNAGTAIDNMPTCGVFAVTADIKSWSGFAKAKKEFLFFDYPKK